MSVIRNLYSAVSTIMNMKMNLFGFHISFMNIFVFSMIVCICAIFIRNLLS